jgi:nucleotide-binding universal stress UspA family protein
MGTHGRTGLARFALGSVADVMVREGTTPVLLVRSLQEPKARMETALVPLDGSILAEEALPTVESLSGKPLRHVQLLRAVASSDEEAGAMAYLERVAERLRAARLTTRLMVETTTPADAITQWGRNADVVILSTHGRGGFDRLRHGSVAEQGTRYLTTPTLLVRTRLAAPSTEPVRAMTYALA